MTLPTKLWAYLVPWLRGRYSCLELIYEWVGKIIDYKNNHKEVKVGVDYIHPLLNDVLQQNNNKKKTKKKEAGSCLRYIVSISTNSICSNLKLNTTHISRCWRFFYGMTKKLHLLLTTIYSTVIRGHMTLGIFDSMPQ